MDGTGRYKKRGNLGGARHGDAYQVHLLILLSERADSGRFGISDDFRLATELEPAELFDDAVLSWRKGNIVDQWLFVQVKYKQQKMYLEERNLFPENRQGEFSICKYLESFWKIKHRGEFKGNKQFIIFTNCGLAKCVQDWFEDGRTEMESILTLDMNGVQVMKLKPKDEHYGKLCAVNSDFIELTKIVRSTLIGGRTCNLGLVRKYRSAIVRQVLVVDTDKGSVRFAPRFINNKNLLHAEQVFRRKLFPEDATSNQLNSYCVHNTDLYKILTSKEDSLHTLPVFVEKAEIEEFLNSLIFAINQPDNVGLNMAITNDLKLRHKRLVQGPNTGDNYASLAFSRLQRKIYDCLDARKGLSICKPELEQIFRDVEKTMESPIMNFPTILFRDEMLNYRVKFEDPIPPIPEMYPAAIVTSNSLLTCLKVFQNMPEESFYYFTLRDIQNKFIRNKLCEVLWEQKTTVYLLLKDDNCPQFEFSSEILEAVASGNSIKFILLTDCEESASNFFNEHTYTLVKEEEITLGQLTESSQEILRSKTVLFQGFELQLSELADDSVLGQVVKDETLEKLLLDEIVTIGPTLPELGVKLYISRTITHLSTTTNTIGCTTYNEDQFLDHLPTVQRKVVILSSTAGMGKTTLWKKLAILAKSRFQTEWVFYLKLHECEEHFNNSKNLDVIDFLKNQFGLSQLDAVLLLRKLEKHERVYVFVDGFDELPFKSMEFAIHMLRVLQESTQVLMSTRTSLVKKLEDAFSVDAFSLEPFSKSDEVALFKCLCDVIDGDVDNPLSKLIERLLDEIHGKSMLTSSEIVGIPLMVNMLAEIYKSNMEEYQKTEDPSELQMDLEDLNIGQLFEKFVYISFRKHTNLLIANHNTQLMLDPDNYIYRGFVKLHSYLGLKNLVNDQKIIRDKQELQELEQQFQLLDSPIVDHVLNQPTKSIFIYSSIAEFFAAKCLFQYLSRMKNVQFKGTIVRNGKKRILRKKKVSWKRLIDQYYQILRDYPTVRYFFFFFAHHHKDCLLKLELMLWCMRRNTHIFLWACEENFEELAKRLVQEDPKVINCMNELGETALHLAAKRGHRQICALLIDNKLNVDVQDVFKLTPLHIAASMGRSEVAELLIVRGATVDATSRRGETPLFSAAMSGHLNVVELLAKKGCDLNKLNFMQFNALHLAAFNKHLHVVRFLMEKGLQLKIDFDANFYYAKKYFGMDPLELIEEKNCNEIKSLLAAWCNESDPEKIFDMLSRPNTQFRVTDKHIFQMNAV